MSKKILIIDDENLVIKSVGRLLSKEGYSFIACKNGAEALEKSQDSEIVLIICDVRMPDIDGIETIKKIRDANTSRNRKRIPEILITGYAEESSLHEAEALQITDFLYKPFDLRDFMTCIKKHIGQP